MVVEENQTQTLTISDSDVQRISQAVTDSMSGAQGDVLARLDGLNSTILAASDGINANVASVRSDPSVSQVVSFSTDQWQQLNDCNTFQNGALLFLLALVSVLVGMRFFSEFSRGFRRA